MIKNAALLLAASMFSAGAATLWNENTQGDLSDDWTAPSTFVVQDGSNTLSVFTTGGDRELFTIVVPAGLQVASLNLLAYNHAIPGNETFLGFQDGPTLLQDPATFTVGVADQISWLTYGSSREGQNLFNAMSSSVNASPPPLGPGSYAFWINELEELPAFTALEFAVEPAAVPEPASPLLAALGGLLILCPRARAHRQY